MKTHFFPLTAAPALLLFTACSSSSNSRSSSSAATPHSYGEATENQHERYGGRELGPHPGAAGYDPSMDRSTR
jgi:hypothetical protein